MSSSRAFPDRVARENRSGWARARWLRAALSAALVLRCASAGAQVAVAPPPTVDPSASTTSPRPGDPRDLATSATAPDEAPPAKTLDPPSWRPGGPIPPGYQLALSPRRWLVSAGATLFALSYLGSAAGATTSYDTDDETASSRAALWIPAIGPFLVMGDTKSASADVLLALDGLAQIGGLTMFVYGLALPVSVLIPKVAGSDVECSVRLFAMRGAPGGSIEGTF
jgi:hypothetical protein